MRDRTRARLAKVLRRAPVISELWDQFERMQSQRDAALAESDAALTERDRATAERNTAVAARDAADAMNNMPPFATNPGWTEDILYNDWRDLVGEKTRALWNTLSREQQIAIASDTGVEHDRQARALRATQLEPMNLDLVVRQNNMFYARVIIEHDEVLMPRPHTYIYRAVENLISSDFSAIEELAKEVKKSAFDAGYAKISAERVNDAEPYLNNTYYQLGDPLGLYGMISKFRPKKIIEVGSGNTTKFMRRAIRDNGLKTHLTCINPTPTTEIAGLAETVIKKPVHSVDFNLFESLENNDILFWDGSHVVFNGSDVVTLFLDIMPTLKPGVLIHIHDIQLPLEYDRGYSSHYYAEQYMLAATLLAGSSWRTLLPQYYLTCRGHEDFRGRAYWIMREN